RWLDRVRASDEARARAALAATARGVAADVARELADLHHHFAWTRDPGARTAAAGLADWRRQSVHPDLVQGLLRRERTADGGLIWHALDEATGAWDTQIPEEVRRALETAQDLADGEREVVGRRGRTGP